jgi:hypothetical protein
MDDGINAPQSFQKSVPVAYVADDQIDIAGKMNGTGLSEVDRRGQ